MPDFLPFQHPKTVETPPRGGGWRHEVKLDGYRMQLRVEGGRCGWRTREAHDWTARFPDVSAIVRALPDGIYDGELCVLDDDGRPDFSALRSAVGRRQAGAIEGQLVLFLFDLLWAEGEDVRSRPLEDRLARLEQAAGAVLDDTVRLSQALPGSGPTLLDAACRLELEGIVSKRLGSTYEGGEVRRETWLKSKCRPSGEVVIGGWRVQEGRFRSLLAGQMDQGKLRYVGRVHTGYSAAKLAELMPKLRALETSRSPFEPGDAPRLRGVHWVRPELVARVTYAEITRSGKLRQAAYHGLREDKAPAHVTAEAPAPAPAALAGSRRKPRKSSAVALDNPDKALWPATAEAPAVTKADLAAYYEAVSPWLLPYVAGRPCTVVIAPDGITGPATYVRHEGHWQGLIRTSPRITHWRVAEKAKTYPGFDTAEALRVAADIAVVEIHPWNSVAGAPMRPGRLVFDLDPEASHDFREIIEAAFELKDRLESYGLSAFLKTSGGRGVHVVTPIAQDPDAPTTWEVARGFAKRVCEQMAGDSPDRYTTALPKAQRRGRIFLDYLRNDPGHHAVGLLSPRAAPGATVSMPATWAEARKRLSNADFTVRNAVARLRRGDPWAGYAEAAAPLPIGARRAGLRGAGLRAGPA
jgi:bifunctional non-homologous end joining protein LigD